MHFPTLGGKQFWTDYVWRDGWRIQRHAIIGHWRLLDNKNRRQAWGSRYRCNAVLEDRVHEWTSPRSQVVVLLHGLNCTARSMRGMGRYLAGKLDCEPVYLEYASMLKLVPDHAMALREVIQGIPKGLPIHFVAHSMGSIVIRRLLGDLGRDGQTEQLDRIQSIVMLGPPNQGASIARLLSRVGFLPLITGRGGRQLGPSWNELEPTLAIPHCPFGIVAGATASPLPNNPLLDGPNDFIVSVQETRLAGASDMLLVKCLHNLFMNAREVQEATLRFIQTNQFR